MYLSRIICCHSSYTSHHSILAMLGTIVTTLQLLYLWRAITVQRRQQTEAANYNMHANQAIFWIISPFLRLPSLSWTPVIHSMLLAIAFPVLLHVYREGGLNTTGRYGIVMMHNVPQIYAANAHIILDVLDGIIRVFAITIGIFDAILIAPIEGFPPRNTPRAAPCPELRHSQRAALGQALPDALCQGECEVDEAFVS
ncbi:hypothetical protein OH76DRAFT_1396698 [Lentinus brumalis]|uniref:Uncharacterized protein n=1 Tax=Lentinus brumalis TaxID=2498619 RepID=A0A371DS50_9APHY|nr:hypothetical protein OH76DRAFT_1396698 [Polyporus brumalis]